MLESLRTLHRSGNLAVPLERSAHALSMAPHGLAVGIAGTFDVKNYGDLLFPLIAAEALKRRDPRINVVPFSVNGRSELSWPFQVRSMEEMIAAISTLSAMLIGGGQIVRFDKSYPIPAPAGIDLPFAYWLTPAVQAALIGKPVIWNAVGASVGWLHSPWHDELSREWLAPKLMSEIIGRSEFVIASSLHASITALSYGVPVARVPVSWGRNKFELLDEFEGIAPLDRSEALARLVKRGRRIEPRVIECADRLDRYWDEVRDVVLQPPIEHGNLSRTLMLSWAAKVCGDLRRLGLTRRLAVTLRESLAGYFPKQRAALHHGLWFLRGSVGVVFRWIARGMASLITERTITERTIAEATTAKLKAKAAIRPVPVDGIGAGKS